MRRRLGLRVTRLLAEDLLLLCWDDDKGAADSHCSTGLGTGIAGALLVEAITAGALDVRDGRVHVTGTAPQDPLLAEVVAATGGSRRPKKIKRLVGHLSHRKRTAAVLERLVAAGTLTRREKRVLGLFPVTRHPVADRRAAKDVRGRERDLLLGRRQPRDADSRDVMLAKLAKSTGALHVLVERRQRKEAGKRADAFEVGSDVPEAVGKAIEEAQAAVVAAIAGAAAAAASS